MPSQQFGVPKSLPCSTPPCSDTALDTAAPTPARFSPPSTSVLTDSAPIPPRGGMPSAWGWQGEHWLAPGRVLVKCAPRFAGGTTHFLRSDRAD